MLSAMRKLLHHERPVGERDQLPRSLERGLEVPVAAGEKRIKESEGVFFRVDVSDYS
jgi:hypothetical protein